MIINLLGLMVFLALFSLIVLPLGLELTHEHGRTAGEVMGRVYIAMLIATIVAIVYWVKDPPNNKRQALIAVMAAALCLIATVVAAVLFE